MSIEPLQKAVQILGGQSATARALSTATRKIVQAHIYKWLNSPNPDQTPPAEYCPSLERATDDAGERVSCEELRPDVDWSVLRNSGPLNQPLLTGVDRRVEDRRVHDQRAGDRRIPDLFEAAASAEKEKAV